MDIHRYRSDVIPNVCRKLFDSVCAFNFRCNHTLTVYYHHLIVTVIAVIHLTGYATLLFTRYAPFTPFIFTRWPCDYALDTVNAVRFPTFPFKKSVVSLYFFIIIVNSS